MRRSCSIKIKSTNSNVEEVHFQIWRTYSNLWGWRRVVKFTGCFSGTNARYRKSKKGLIKNLVKEANTYRGILTEKDLAILDELEGEYKDLLKQPD